MNRMTRVALNSPASVDDTVQGAQHFAASLARLQANAARAAIECNIEAVDFLKHRLRRDADFVSRVADSREPAEVLELCMDFWRKAVSEYSAEAERMAAIGGSASAAAVGSTPRAQAETALAASN